MKKIYLLMLCYILGWLKPVMGQYSYEFLKVPDSVVSRMQGKGVHIFNAHVMCADSAAAIVRGDGSMGIDTGLFLATHYVQHAFKPMVFDSAYRNKREYYGLGGVHPGGLYPRQSFRPSIKREKEGEALGYWSITHTSPYDTSFGMSLYRLMPPRAKYIKNKGSEKLVYDVDSHHTFIRSSCGVVYDFVADHDSISLDFVYMNALLDLPIRNLHTLYLGGANDGDLEHCDTFHWQHHGSMVGILLMNKDDTVNLGVYERLSEKGERIPVNHYTLRVDRDSLEYTFDYFAKIRIGAPIVPESGRKKSLYWDTKPYKDYLVDNRESKVKDYLSYTMMTRAIRAQAVVNACDTYSMAISIGHVKDWLVCTFFDDTLGVTISDKRFPYRDMFGSALMVGKMNVVDQASHPPCPGFESPDDPDGDGGGDGGTRVSTYRLSNHCSVGPNPFVDEVLIRFDRTLAQETGFELRIMNMVGQEVLQAQGDLYELNEQLQRWAPTSATGMYVLQLMHPRLGQQHWKLTKLEK